MKTKFLAAVGSALGGTGATILGAGAGAYLGNQAAKRY